MKVISICNQKGGVAKTTTALALIEGLTEQGYNVLGVDLDAQGNLSVGIGAEKKGATALSLFTQEAEAVNTIQVTPIAGIIPYSNKLTLIDGLLEETGKEYKLKESLETLSGYDYIILDTPPALGLITINALTASDYVVVPAQADLFSLQGMNDLSKTIQAVKKYTNPDLVVAGVLVTMFNNRTRVEKEAVEVIEKLSKEMDTTVFTTKIRNSCKVKESVFSQKSIIGYAPTSTIAQDYRAFIEELQQRGV